MSMRDVYIASNCLADAIVKAEFMSTDDLEALIEDVQRWLSDELGDEVYDAADAVIDAYGKYLIALHDESVR